CLHLSPRSSSPPSCPYTPLFRSARRTWGGDSMESGQVLVVGAGPAGLCVALALAARGMEVEVVERQRREALAMPAFDGREIALTHGSMRILRQLGVWDRIPLAEISPLRLARVLDGDHP